MFNKMETKTPDEKLDPVARIVIELNVKTGEFNLKERPALTSLFYGMLGMAEMLVTKDTVKNEIVKEVLKQSILKPGMLDALKTGGPH